MAVKLNSACVAHCKGLIKAGKVNKTVAWSFTSEDEDAMLGPNKDNWGMYAMCHMGEDDSEPEKTKARYKYPCCKCDSDMNCTVYRSGLIAIRQRAGQQGEKDIFDAAGELLDLIDGNDKDGDEGKKGSALIQHRFNAALRAAPWALMPEHMGLVAGPAQAAPMRRSGSAGMRAGAIAVIPISGVMTPGGYYDGGDCSTDMVCAALMDALSDDTVGAVLLDINSPGGSVYGTGELGDMVFAARKVKPVIAVANSLAASAAYWVGSQASEMYVTPGGEVGSIGVYTAHMDMSGMLEAYGLKVTLISAGKYKTEGNPFAPLDDDAKAAIQASVDGYYGMFTSAVARGRNAPVATVRDGMGQGRVLSAKDAQTAGMVDGIATRADVIRGMAKKLKGAQGSVAELIAAPDVIDPPAAETATDELARQCAAQRRERELLLLSV